MLEWRLNRSFRYLVYPQWEATGLRHGFIGASANFRDAVLVENSRYFCRDFNTDRLVVLNQVHGKDIVRLPESGAEADGIIVPLETASAGAYAIRTADCLAVFIRSRGGFVMVHAGWRGLAAGIIKNAVRVFDDPQLEILCWPCAGCESYEVGSEVIEAIGDSAVFHRFGNKIILNLSATAERQVRNIAPYAKFVESGLCTISNLDFHSFRRDRENRGSNLAFLIT